MARPPKPRIIVCRAAMQTLREGNLGELLEMPDLTLRWLANRYVDQEEMPAISLAFVADEPVDQVSQYLSSGEAERVLALDIIADAILPTETENEEAVAAGGEDLDLDRIQILSDMTDEAVALLKRGFIDPADAATPITPVCHWVQDLGISEDEDLVDTNGRLVARVNLLYRVRSDDPTVLLMTGFQGS